MQKHKQPDGRSFLRTFRKHAPVSYTHLDVYKRQEINNAVVLELDKLNFVFVLNGKDMLAQIRSQC